jgi:hypothetical protein
MYMGTGASFVFAFAGMFVAAIGVFIVGELALMFAILLFGVSIMALATELDERTSPKGAKAVRGWGPTCSSCGGDLQEGETSCPHCGRPISAEEVVEDSR